MAVNLQEKTSFRQFEYCSFCRLNHKKGKKHLYSTKHRTIIHNILDKAQKKISDAKDTLPAPQVEPFGKTDVKQNFWCYFCVTEIARHQTLDVCVLKHGSMLEHIASEEHTKKTADFFRAHRVDESVRGRDVHCLSPDEIKAFKLLTVHAVRKFEARKKHQNSTIANRLREQEAMRRNISQSEDWKTGLQQQQVLGAEILEDVSGYQGDCFQSDGVSYLSMNEDNMTSISSQHFTDEGINTEEKERDGEIGPTLEHYQQHVTSEQKRKLSTHHTSSSFHSSSDKCESWPPLRGQAWHPGRHISSKQCFEKETKRLTLLGKRMKSGFPQERYSGKPTGAQGAETSQLQTKLAMPYQSRRQRTHDPPTCGVNNPSQTNITASYGIVRGLAFSAQGSNKPIENSHNTRGTNDNHGYKGFISSTNLQPYRQDHSDMDREISPQGQQNRSHKQMTESPHQREVSKNTSDIQCDIKETNSALCAPISKLDSDWPSSEYPTLRTRLISTPLVDKKQ